MWPLVGKIIHTHTRFYLKTKWSDTKYRCYTSSEETEVSEESCMEEGDGAEH